MIALASTSLLLSVVIGLVWLGEREAGRARLTGAALVTLGAALVGLYG